MKSLQLLGSLRIGDGSDYTCATSAITSDLLTIPELSRVATGAATFGIDRGIQSCRSVAASRISFGRSRRAHFE